MIVHSIPSGLYPIIDINHLPYASLLEAALPVLRSGVEWVQVRAKQWAGDEFAGQVRAVAALRARFAFKVIVNHSLDVAEAVRADGVHLTARSVRVAAARQRLGMEAIIGYSAHSLAEALEAERDGADYVTLGAIFPTPYKSSDHPVHGVEGLRKVVDALSIPVIAVGGIGLAEISGVRAAGAHGFSVIRGILAAADPGKAAEALVIKWKEVMNPQT